MVDHINTHLTKRQLEVLEKKRKGKNIRDIAAELNTSKSNISHILESAVKNIEKAENTLKLVRTIEWPIRMEFESGMDLYEISRKVFERADEEGIHLDFTGSEIVSLLGDKISDGVKNRKIQADIRLLMNEEGELEILVY